MEFEWDEAKNRENIRKHGIDFETAKGPCFGPTLTRRGSRRDYGEDRYVSVGQMGGGALAVVVHTERGRRIRLISARPASRRERQAYHERTR